MAGLVMKLYVSSPTSVRGVALGRVWRGAGWARSCGGRACGAAVCPAGSSTCVQRAAHAFELLAAANGHAPICPLVAPRSSRPHLLTSLGPRPLCGPALWRPAAQVMLDGLQAAWGGKTEAQTAQRMLKMAQGLSGGIELAG